MAEMALTSKSGLDKGSDAGAVTRARASVVEAR